MVRATEQRRSVLRYEEVQGECMIKKLIKLPIKSVVCRPQVRTRFDGKSITEIAETAKLVGIQSPILVWQDGHEWVLVDGAIRLNAAMEAGETTILAAVLDGPLTPAERIQRQLFCNRHADLCVTDKAQAVADYMREAGCTASEAATRLAIEPGTVAKLLAIASISETVKELIAKSGFGLSKAYQVTLAGNEEAQLRLAQDLANGTVTRDGAAAQRKSKRKPHRGSRKDVQGDGRIVVPLGGGRSVAIAGPGLTLATVIEWLTELVERLRGAREQGTELSEAIKPVAQS